MPRQRQNPVPRTQRARRIDAAAEWSGLTNEEIAQQVGVSVGNISHWRIGRHEPDADTLQRYARVTGPRYRRTTYRQATRQTLGR